MAPQEAEKWLKLGLIPKMSMSKISRLTLIFCHFQDTRLILTSFFYLRFSDFKFLGSTHFDFPFYKFPFFQSLIFFQFINQKKVK